MLNAIETAVNPLKQDAINRAEQYAREVIASVLEQLAAVGNDLNAAAPAPKAWTAPTATAMQYKAAQRKRDMFKALRSVDGQAKFVKEAQENAAFQYEAFVAKLNAKIGPVVSATLEGNHVWSHSLLTVVLPTGEKQIWKTQTIINVSKYGKVFNQFPTRKVGQ